MPDTAVMTPEEVAKIAADAASKAIADFALDLRDPNALAARAATREAEARRKAASKVTDDTAAAAIRLAGQPDDGQRYAAVVYDRTVPGESKLSGGLAWSIVERATGSRVCTSLDVMPATVFGSADAASKSCLDYFTRKAKVGVFAI